MLSLPLMVRCMLLVVAAMCGEDDSESVWDELGGPAQAKWPDPLAQLTWRDSVRPALAEARRDGRPLFVTFRCLPCKQCADFDQNVLEGGPELTPLLRQFITVRLTDASDLDMNIFPAQGFQDFDLSWWGYLLSPQGQVYGVFGGRDHISDKTRISVRALVNTLARVLNHHYDSRRTRWNLDGKQADLAAAPQLPDTLPGYASWLKRRPQFEEQNCLHCHQVAEVLRQPQLDRDTFDIVKDLGIWPLPENVGLVLNRDHGLRVEKVQDDGPAARAGIRPGDHLLGAGGRRLFGQADFRGVLHRQADPGGTIDIHWLRDGQRKSATLHLRPGWRKTNLNWRTSVAQGNIGAGPGFAWAHRGPREGITPGKMSMRPWFGPHPERSIAYRAGLRRRHIITAVEGHSTDLYGRAFMIWFRLQHKAGDQVTLTILDGANQRQLTYTLE
ncbi:MAG: PDZ domain-containing protein [Planctomycetota bacterium]|nr:PDZ domain-containing protein [Planctomycetota bacterium]